MIYLLLSGKTTTVSGASDPLSSLTAVGCAGALSSGCSAEATGCSDSTGCSSLIVVAVDSTLVAELLSRRLPKIFQFRHIYSSHHFLKACPIHYS